MHFFREGRERNRLFVSQTPPPSPDRCKEPRPLLLRGGNKGMENLALHIPPAEGLQAHPFSLNFSEQECLGKCHQNLGVSLRYENGIAVGSVGHPFHMGCKWVTIQLREARMTVKRIRRRESLIPPFPLRERGASEPCFLVQTQLLVPFLKRHLKNLNSTEEIHGNSEGIKRDIPKERRGHNASQSSTRPVAQVSLITCRLGEEGLRCRKGI